MYGEAVGAHHRCQDSALFGVRKKMTGQKAPWGFGMLTVVYWITVAWLWGSLLCN